jgi:hypothetical protein
MNTKGRSFEGVQYTTIVGVLRIFPFTDLDSEVCIRIESAPVPITDESEFKLPRYDGPDLRLADFPFEELARTA